MNTTPAKISVTKIGVTLESLVDIAFDRFIDYSSDKLPPDQKLYLDEKRGLYLPSWNIDAFLWGEYPPGACANAEGKKRKNYIGVGQSTVSIDEIQIPFMRHKTQVVVKKDITQDAHFWMLNVGGRTRKGNLSIKAVPRLRPVLKTPWELNFTITLVQNDRIDAQKLYNYFVSGGGYIGLGTFRPKFGRFAVTRWDIKE